MLVPLPVPQLRGVRTVRVRVLMAASTLLVSVVFVSWWWCVSPTPHSSLHHHPTSFSDASVSSHATRPEASPSRSTYRWSSHRRSRSKRAPPICAVVAIPAAPAAPADPTAPADPAAPAVPGVRGRPGVDERDDGLDDACVSVGDSPRYCCSRTWCTTRKKRCSRRKRNWSTRESKRSRCRRRYSRDANSASSPESVWTTRDAATASVPALAPSAGSNLSPRPNRSERTHAAIRRTFRRTILIAN